MECIVKHFSQLTADELFLIYKLRVSVFVVEQNCSYQEVDDFDREASRRYRSGGSLPSSAAAASVPGCWPKGSGRQRKSCTPKPSASRPRPTPSPFMNGRASARPRRNSWRTASPISGCGWSWNNQQPPVQAYQGLSLSKNKFGGNVKIGAGVKVTKKRAKIRSLGSSPF